LKRKPTFAAFIDLKKAYDSVDRVLAFTKLHDIGIVGNMYGALLSLYNDVKCCVRLNCVKTDWFAVNCGLRQGCSLSPILFNLCVNDIVEYMQRLDIGVDVGGEKVSMLLYADDIVLLGESECEVQMALDVLSQWCETNWIKVNVSK
jgi:hypothetical protein